MFNLIHHINKAVRLYEFLCKKKIPHVEKALHNTCIHVDLCFTVKVDPLYKFLSASRNNN